MRNNRISQDGVRKFARALEANAARGVSAVFVRRDGRLDALAGAGAAAAIAYARTYMRRPRPPRAFPSEKRVRGVALELAAVDVEATPPPSPEAVTAREIPHLPTATTRTPTVWELSSQEPLGAYGEWAKAPVAP